MSRSELHKNLAAIGITISSDSFTRSKALRVDIEQTLIEAAQAIGQGDDRRLLGLILSWIKVHGEIVNMKRLQKLLKQGEAPLWIRLFAFYGLSIGESRWKILAKKLDKGTTLANEDLEMALKRAAFRGEEEWSKDTGFIVALNSETINEKFVLSSTQVAQINLMYRSRLIFGASWRADIITSMALGAKTPTEAARLSRSSYEPAHRIFKELEMAGSDSRRLVNLK